MLNRAAKNAINTCLAVKQGEEVLIITDLGRLNIAKALYNEAEKAGADPMIKIIKPRSIHGEEPPATVFEAMKMADVVIAPTEKSLTHTNARRIACGKHETRIATLPTITEEIFIRGLSADYNEVKKLSLRVMRAINKARKAKVTSPSGTNLEFDLRNEFMADTGIYTKKGEFGNLPAGEADGAPAERKTQGTLVIDRYENIITKPTKIIIKDGAAVDFKQTRGGMEFKKLLDKSIRADKNKNAFNIAEFGIGTNPKAKITGCVLEDEKVLGTCHIAFGDNTSYPGGKNFASAHEDCIVFKPTILLDGKPIMKNGKLLI